ncbi:MAG: hypothetical protein OEZ65_15320 [Gemmatimonadota bacterium]|nr:hypothetical protein [Gemmatimonadota bacterium]MDH5760952.1 hypothetical protein [Gemmatimonadota bacterium]
MRALPWPPCVVILASTLFLLPRESLAQESRPAPPPRRIEAELLYLTGSWVWDTESGWSIGPDFGFGLLEQKTLAPAEDDFTALVHIGVSAARNLSPRVTSEFGLRTGVAELRSQACSGCVPGTYWAATVALLGGVGRFQMGPRATVGRMGGDGFFAVSPFLVGIRF